MDIEDLLEQGGRALDNGDYRAANDFLSKAVALQPSAEAWHLLAEAQIGEGQLKQAYKSLSAGLTLAEDDIDLLFSLGDLYLEENRNAEALTTYQKIIDLDPAEIDAWVASMLSR